MKNPFKKTPIKIETSEPIIQIDDEEYIQAQDTANGVGGYETEAIAEIEKYKKLFSEESPVSSDPVSSDPISSDII